MKILITGGSGFVGKNICSSLSKKFTLFVPTHRQLDIEDSKALRRYLVRNQIETIIHCAVEGGNQVLESQLLMFSSLLNNLDLVDKLIYFGSGAEYTKIRNLKKNSEKDIGQYIPRDRYGLGKYICNQLAQQNKKIINLRLFGVYGRYENYEYTFISNSIVKNLLSLPIVIKQDVIFDYLYIDDLIPIVEYFITHKAKFTDYNITPNHSISLKKIVTIINNISDKPSPVSILTTGKNFSYTGSNLRLLKELGVFNFTSYEEGIKKLFRYYQKNLEKIDKTAIMQDDFLKKAKTRS